MTEKIIHIFVGEDRSRVDMYCFPIGKDYQVFILGGEHHIGAVSLGINAKLQSNKTSVSVLSVPGHREDKITLKTARRLCTNIPANFVVTAGIHYDNLITDELNKFLYNIDKLCTELIDILSHRSI